MLSTLKSTLIAFAMTVLTLGNAHAQNWNWRSEKIDSSGQYSSVAVDKDGNLHVSYSTSDGIKYAYRAVDSNRWFTMLLDKPEGFTSLALDQDQHPHICYTNNELKYAAWDGKSFRIQIIAPFSGQINYSCSVAIGKDGTPHISWYQYMNADRTNFLHLKYAALKEGAWQARTIDLRPETGKWNSMVLDKEGNPHLAYSSYMDGDLKYAWFTGKKWILATPDSRAASRTQKYRGMGNSVKLDANGIAHISYFEDLTLKYAKQSGDSWNVIAIDNLSSALGAAGWSNSRSTLVLDSKGWPHIFYGDIGSLKHAFWNGSEWKMQFITYGGAMQFAYTSAAIGKDDTLYVSYLDPVEGSLNVAIGTRGDQATQPKTESTTPATKTTDGIRQDSNQKPIEQPSANLSSTPRNR
jgi:hypothetical protein